jgi:hypothetical protein
VQGTNDTSIAGYTGPCLQAGEMLRYLFRVCRLDDFLKIPGGFDKKYTPFHNARAYPPVGGDGDRCIADIDPSGSGKGQCRNRSAPRMPLQVSGTAGL